MADAGVQAATRVRSLWIGNLRVVPDTTEFAEVIARFHAGQPRDTVEDGDNVHVLCYSLAGTKGAVLTLESSDLGGAGHAILAFRVSADGHAGNGCPTIPVRPSEVRTDDGLQLGISRADFLARVRGMSVDEKGDELTATSASRITDARGTWDLLTGVRARLRDDRVRDLYLWMTATT